MVLIKFDKRLWNISVNWIVYDNISHLTSNIIYIWVYKMAQLSELHPNDNLRCIAMQIEIILKVVNKTLWYKKTKARSF